MSTNETPSEHKDRKLSEDQLFESLIIESQNVPGDNRVFEDGREIPWLDMDLAQSGQMFFRKHYTALLIAHDLYFALSFGFKPITGVIVKTKGLRGIDGVTKRLLATIWHVLSWYEEDILGTYSPGTKAIANVRKTHDAIRRKYVRPPAAVDFADEEQIFRQAIPDPIATALNEDMKFLDTSTYRKMDINYNPPQPMSQLSMAWMQLTFLLPVMAHPSAFGIHDTEGVEGFEHLWALIGHLTGIEDRFNIPLQKPGKAFYIRYFKQVFLPTLLVRDSKIDVIQKSFFKSSNSYIPQMSITASLYFFLKQTTEMNGFSGSGLYKLMALGDRLIVFLIGIVLWMLRWSGVRYCVNWAVRSQMQKVLAKYAKEEEEEEGREFTFLPLDTKWSEKYRRRSEGVLYKWKKTAAILDMMKVSNKKTNKGKNK